LIGELRIGGTVLPGTRTEWLPFPCHPRHHAFLSALDPTMPVQYWEQTCRTEGCGMAYRFEHSGRQIRWYPIVGLTDAGSPQAVPLDRYAVEARLEREQGANLSRAPVIASRGGDGPNAVEVFGTAGGLTTAHT
jgi:hypothetical protein